ncbi:Elongator subunit elp2 [Dinochytrium kinnereticum]|nr:Elongator subunit elp2 [Dinochytrium kinnereticum]
MSEINLDFVSIACNRTGSCADWSQDGTGVIYGGGQFVCTYDPKDASRRGISETLRGHKGRVNAVKFLRRGKHEDQREVGFVSGSADGTCRIWRKGIEGWVSTAELSGHTESVNAIGVARGLSIPGTHDFIATASADGSFDQLLTLQGHTDWIRSIDITTFTATENNSATLPEFSDGDILIASSSQDKTIRLWKITSSVSRNSSNAASDGFDSMLASLSGGSQEGGVKLSTKAHMFSIDTTSGSVLTWSPYGGGGIWVTEARLGDVGGATLGYYGAVYSNDGKWILAQNYLGALNTWQLVSPDQQIWQPFSSLSGHSAAVKGLSWDPSGSYFASTSLDQTTRLFSTWKREDQVTWHEISRPQIHGYDLNCISFFKKFSFVSGADEKVLRVFEAPKAFTSVYNGLANPDSTLSENDPEKSRVITASVPALGLSNKAVSDNVEFSNSTESLVEVRTDSPPFEQFLMQHSLWPETNKLYGHAFELICVTSNHSGTLIASASKATKPEFAALRVWSTANWKEVTTPLMSHSLTVTDIKFSPNDEYLLSVGRDRMWSLFRKTQDGSSVFCTSGTKESFKDQHLNLQHQVAPTLALSGRAPGQPVESISEQHLVTKRSKYGSSLMS